MLFPFILREAKRSRRIHVSAFLDPATVRRITGWLVNVAFGQELLNDYVCA